MANDLCPGLKKESEFSYKLWHAIKCLVRELSPVCYQGLCIPYFYLQVFVIILYVFGCVLCVFMLVQS